MSDFVTTSEALQFLVESPTDKVGYVKHFYFNENHWKITSFRVSSIQGIIKNHIILPFSSIDRIDVSSRRVFIKDTSSSISNGKEQETAIQDLHTTEDLTRCEIRTPERSLGKVEDVFFNPTNGTIENIVVKIHKMIAVKHILLQPNQIKQVAWGEERLYVSVHEAELLNAPEFKHSDSHFQATHIFG